MAGIEAGKTWSRIGAEVAPTSSAASGVWGDLNEVAENVGAGTWPAPFFGAWSHHGPFLGTMGLQGAIWKPWGTHEHRQLNLLKLLNPRNGALI